MYRKKIRRFEQVLRKKLKCFFLSRLIMLLQPCFCGLNCDTDSCLADFFHIAAMTPKYITSDEITANEINHFNGDELREYYKANCLMEQEYYKNPNKSVEDVFLEFISILRENVTVKRFVCLEVGK